MIAEELTEFAEKAIAIAENEGSSDHILANKVLFRELIPWCTANDALYRHKGNQHRNREREPPRCAASCARQVLPGKSHRLHYRAHQQVEGPPRSVPRISNLRYTSGHYRHWEGKQRGEIHPGTEFLTFRVAAVTKEILSLVHSSGQSSLHDDIQMGDAVTSRVSETQQLKTRLIGFSLVVHRGERR